MMLTLCLQKSLRHFLAFIAFVIFGLLAGKMDLWLFLKWPMEVTFEFTSVFLNGPFSASFSLFLSFQYS